MTTQENDSVLNKARVSEAASRFMGRNKKERAALRAKIEEARSSSEKEPFDFETFAKLYDVSQDYGAAPITEKTKERYEEEYYLGPIEADTIKAFAERKQELKLHDAN